MSYKHENTSEIEEFISITAKTEEWNKCRTYLDQYFNISHEYITY